MECNDIPTTNKGYCDHVALLRDQIVDAVEIHGKDASKHIVENTLNTIISKSVLEEVFSKWPEQKPALEELLITTFLDKIVRMNMEPERGENDRYLYTFATEGRCLHKEHKKSDNPFGFVKGEPIADLDSLYTFDELIKNWREIFILDEIIEASSDKRSIYAPRCKHDNYSVHALIITTQHQLKIVNQDGKYVEGTNISFCRTKSGMGYLIKLAQYLTGLRANGKERTSIDDYLAALSREPENYDGIKRYKKAIQLVKDITKETHSDLRNMMRLRGYTQREADKLRKTLEEYPEIRGFVKRPDLEVYLEPLPKDRKGKFAEIWLPSSDGNKICWQVYHDRGKGSYTEIEGDRNTKHVEYKTKKEQDILKGFTPWHWSIIRRLAPYFVDEYLKEGLDKIYGPYLNLKHFKNK